MKTADIRWWVFLFVFVAILIAGSFYAGIRYEKSRETEVQSDTIVVVRIDTIKVEKPVYITERLTDTLFLPITDTIRVNDTLYLTVPRTQRKYEKDSLYRAWVSGYKPQLDSIYVFPKVTTVTVTEITRIPPRRWGVGVIGGYGVGKSGLSPFVGVGVYYNMIRIK